MDKKDCIARLHLLGFDTAKEQPFTALNDKPQNKSMTYCFVMLTTKPNYIGYLTSLNVFTTPTYFSTYENMVEKALELKAYDKN